MMCRNCCVKLSRKQRICLIGGLLVAGLSSVIFTPVSVAGAMPAMLSSQVISALVVDTQDEFDITPGLGLKASMTRTRCIFNLTNGLEIQTRSPAPKPEFVEVRAHCFSTMVSLSQRR